MSIIFTIAWNNIAMEMTFPMELYFTHKLIFIEAQMIDQVMCLVCSKTNDFVIFY